MQKGKRVGLNNLKEASCFKETRFRRQVELLMNKSITNLLIYISLYYLILLILTFIFLENKACEFRFQHQIIHIGHKYFYSVKLFSLFIFQFIIFLSNQVGVL